MHNTIVNTKLPKHKTLEIVQKATSQSIAYKMLEGPLLL